MKFSALIIAAFFCLLCFCSLDCKKFHRNNLHPEITDDQIAQGKILAAQYCQDCHLLPDPSLLDAKHWQQGALPYMGPFLGIFRYQFDIYPSSRSDRFLRPDFYPKKPLLSPEQWQLLMDYFLATSPDSLPGQDRPVPIQNGLELFKAERPSLGYPNASTGYLQVDTTTPSRTILLGDALQKKLFRLNGRLEVQDSILLPGATVGIDFNHGSMTACDIGYLNPNNGKFGKALRISTAKDGKMILDTLPLFDSLARPVQITSVDLNQDGLTDYLVCEFGNMTGALSWMENKGGGKFERHVIRAVPGAIKAYVQDYNHDGLPDLWVLFAQGDEGIFLFTNLGHGQFSGREVLRFPPIYGSSYFELDDFNRDGYPDILYTCGDNADYSKVIKPYHGVYIFLNDGRNNFSQKYFYPIKGCYKAIARDFDGDGDLDIATIAYFPDDAHQPEEGFVYLENKGNFTFQPFSLAATQVGRWLTMDAADLNGDGKIDILLGNFSMGPSFIQSAADFKKGPPFLVLRNVGK
jgi:FG-GAP-like repeat